MAIDVRDRKLLWGRSGNRCAFTNCHRLLVVEAEETGRDTVVSQEAHIVARETDGPRGNSPLSTPERDSYPNLILLCLEHHKVVDDDPDYWTVDRLLDMKAVHEALVEESMTRPDRESLDRELIYAGVVAEWAGRMDLDDWTGEVSSLLAPTPSVSNAMIQMIDDVRRWLFTRPWPGTIPELEAAFENFRRVADAISMVIQNGMEVVDADGTRRLVPLYKKQHVENYDELLEKMEWTVDLIHDLVFELTRAANYVLDAVRLGLDARFRLEEGVVVVERQGAGLYSNVYRPRYSAEEIEAGGYVSFDDFLGDRASRDVYFGQGRHDGGVRDVTPIRVD